MSIFWGIIGILFVFWLLGLVMNLGGNFIHVLLFMALVGILYRIYTERTTS